MNAHSLVHFYIVMVPVFDVICSAMHQQGSVLYHIAGGTYCFDPYCHAVTHSALRGRSLNFLPLLPPLLPLLLPEPGGQSPSPSCERVVKAARAKPEPQTPCVSRKGNSQAASTSRKQQRQSLGRERIAAAAPAAACH